MDINNISADAKEIVTDEAYPATLVPQTASEEDRWTVYPLRRPMVIIPFISYWNNDAEPGQA